MSSFAQSRDLSDRVTIENFAAIVQTMERLKMLFVLTVCDINAVGPGVLDAWKAQLLRVLYWETEVVLGGGHSAVDRKSRVAEAAKPSCARRFHEWSDEAFDAYAKRHYPAYWLKVDVAAQGCGTRNCCARSPTHRAPLATASISTHARRLELTVVAPDQPAAAVDHRRRLRRRRRQYRRRAYFHHGGRPRARHDLLLARL